MPGFDFAMPQEYKNLEKERNKIRLWDIVISVRGQDLTLYYLVLEYKSIVDSYDPTFLFAFPAAKRKALLLREALKNKNIIITDCP